MKIRKVLGEKLGETVNMFSGIEKTVIGVTAFYLVLKLALQYSQHIETVLQIDRLNQQKYHCYSEYGEDDCTCKLIENEIKGRELAPPSQSYYLRPEDEIKIKKAVA